MTAPSSLTVMLSDARSAVPAGTPVLLGPGKSDGARGGEVGAGEAVGLAGAGPGAGVDVTGEGGVAPGAAPAVGLVAAAPLGAGALGGD